MKVVVMGVSGSGKSTIGALLAQRLACGFLDGDDFHPPANVAKMSSGQPLADEDRWPWLQLLNEKLREKENAVLACSALKRSYRDILTRGLQCHLVYLKGSFELLQSRMLARRHKYMPASLLASQFQTLEPPAGAIEIDVADSPEECVRQILEKIR